MLRGVSVTRFFAIRISSLVRYLLSPLALFIYFLKWFYFWLCWVLLLRRFFSSCGEQGLRPFRCPGFSLGCLLSLWAKVSSPGTRACLPQGTWGRTRPGGSPYLLPWQAKSYHWTTRGAPGPFLNWGIWLLMLSFLIYIFNRTFFQLKT